MYHRVAVMYFPMNAIFVTDGSCSVVTPGNPTSFLFVPFPLFGS